MDGSSTHRNKKEMKPERLIGILNKVTSPTALESPNKLKVLNLIWPREAKMVEQHFMQ